VCIKVYIDPLARPGLLDFDAAPSRVETRDFAREFQAYNELKHPNILSVLDYGRDSTQFHTLFLVLPWCEGGDLRRSMSNRQFFPLTDALPILRQVALAIDYAHGRGYVHGDVKPENILFFSPALTHPFLSDFGSARRAAYVERASGAADHSGPGTTAYLAPEQISDDTTTASSDIYSFGTVAYEMLTGRLPVNIGQNPYHQMVAKIGGDIVHASVANPHLPAHAAAALMAALSIKPEDRQATATMVCQMLAGEIPQTGARAAPKRSRRRLSTAQKLALWTAIITTIGTILVAAVNIIPSFRNNTTGQTDTKK